MGEKKLERFFTEHLYLGKLEDAEKKTLAKLCFQEDFKAGQIIFKEGEIGDTGYIIKKGGVKIFKSGYLGDETIVTFGPGDIFGEMAFIDNRPRSAGAKAVSDTELVGIKREVYESLKSEHPSIAVKLMDIFLKLLTERLRTTTLRLLGQF